MPLRLKQIARPEVPLEADNITPDKLRGLGRAEIEKTPLQHGNRRVAIADFFAVDGDAADGVIEVAGDDLGRVKFLGAGMSGGVLRVEGDAGEHLGAGLSGGEIFVSGDAADWVGPEMRGGRIDIRGDAGHAIGSAYRGAAVGMTGGEILIHGGARNEVGNGMRGGLIAIGGDSGDFTGVNMLAGTILVAGRLGIRSGAGMRRGSIVSLHDAEPLPTFRYACKWRPPYLRLYFEHLRRRGLALDEELDNGLFRRYCGDGVELDKGEILLYAGESAGGRTRAAHEKPRRKNV